MIESDFIGDLEICEPDIDNKIEISINLESVWMHQTQVDELINCLLDIRWRND